VIEIRETPAYAAWFAALRDRTARARIDIRIRRLSLGNSGDIRPVGDAVVILLAGGDKSSQNQDIRLAKDLARNL
jgi:putative component of toxin-antitoxin plasmid stabilization module